MAVDRSMFKFNQALLHLHTQNRYGTILNRGYFLLCCAAKRSGIVRLGALCLPVSLLRARIDDDRRNSIAIGGLRKFAVRSKFVLQLAVAVLKCFAFPVRWRLNPIQYSLISRLSVSKPALNLDAFFCSYEMRSGMIFAGKKKGHTRIGRRSPPPPQTLLVLSLFRGNKIILEYWRETLLCVNATG